LEDIKNNIIESARNLFLKYGIKSVTMDDIAQTLAISKKTIYQYFKDKDELVSVVARAHMEMEREAMDTMRQRAQNTIEELVLISRCMRENHMRINPVVFWDLRKYYRTAWEIYQEYKKGVFYQSIRGALERGVRQGYFRSDIDIETLAALRLEQIQMCFNPEIFPDEKFDRVEVQKQLFEHFIYGLLSEKGRKEFFEYISNYQEQ